MTSKIPKVDFIKPELKTTETRFNFKPTKSTLNKIPPASSTSTNVNRITKNPVQSARTFLSRRSKTVAELRSIAKTAQSTKAGSVYRKPLMPINTATVRVAKRNAPPETEATKPKVTKLNMKPAPYDFKAKFNLLLEKHNILKARSTEMEQIISSKDKLLADKELIIQSNISSINLYKSENDSLTFQLKTVTEKYNDLNEKYTELISKTEALENSLQISESEVEKLRQRLLEADNERQKMHNTILDLKGNIRVFCRVRPPLETEDSKSLCILQYPDETTLLLSKNSIEISNNKRNSRQIFNFDKVFPEYSSQEDIFQELALLVQSVLDGYNVCIFAYGQTGSGKTYTMEGGCTDDSLGMIPRTIDCVFSSINARKILGWEFTVTASFLEIYNEHICDLLDNAKNQKPHDILMTDSTGTDVYVSNLTEIEIQTSADLKQLMRIAQQNRAVAKTEMNERSSRSHSVAKITLKGLNKNNNQQCISCINLVDLAGSERPRDSEIVRLTETKNINRSLANLSNVIMNLVDNCDHIPYRNSKLTHLLMPSLGGNSKTLMMVNISPFEECYNESVNSLRFAAQVNQCKTSAKKKNCVRK